MSDIYATSFFASSCPGPHICGPYSEYNFMRPGTLKIFSSLPRAAPVGDGRTHRSPDRLLRLSGCAKRDGVVGADLCVRPPVVFTPVQGHGQVATCPYKIGGLFA